MPAVGQGLQLRLGSAVQTRCPGLTRVPGRTPDRLCVRDHGARRTESIPQRLTQPGHRPSQVEHVQTGTWMWRCCILRILRIDHVLRIWLVSTQAQLAGPPVDTGGKAWRLRRRRSEREGKGEAKIRQTDVYQRFRETWRGSRSDNAIESRALCAA